MGTCQKCKESVVDNHCGCSHSNLFGYDIDINKKNPSSKDPVGSKAEKVGSALKGFDAKKASDSIGDLIKGLKKSPNQSSSPTPNYTPGPATKSSNMGMIIGVIAAIIVIAGILYFTNRKK